MSRYAAVNVRFGADISQFSTAMQNAARQMQRAGDQLQNVGKSMSMNLTAPILALGAASLYAFGEIDALKRGLISFSGSAELAENEFNKLREVAKLPGIGLQEAVKGSINLQAIGMSAEDARKAMQAFGNAIATVGGGKENFDLAIRGFGQLTNASKPLQQDLYQIANQLPQVNKLMIEAFGTNRAEDLAAMGLSGKKLAEFLVDALGKLPPISGGIKNSFENMSDTIKIAMASVGEAIEKNFKISDKINQFANRVTGLIESFKNLRPETQKFIIGFAGVAAAIGPVLLSIGFLVKLFPTVLAGFSVIKGAILLASTAMKGFTASMVGMPALFLAVVGAIGLGVVALNNWKKGTDEASESTKRLNDEIKERLKLEQEADPFFQNIKGFKKAEVQLSTKGADNAYSNWLNKPFEETGKKFELNTMGEKPAAKKNYLPKKVLTETEIAEMKRAQAERDKQITAEAESAGLVLQEKWDWMAKMNSTGFENFTNEAQDMVDNGDLEAVTTSLENRLEDMRVRTTNKLKEFSQSVKDIVIQIKQTFVSGLANMLQDTLMNIGENIATDQDPFANIGNNLLESLGKLMVTIGSLMVTWGVAQAQFETSLVTLNPIGMIAAGAIIAGAGAGIAKAAQGGLKGAATSSGGNAGSYSGGSETLTLQTRLDGNDLYLSGQRTQLVRGR